MQQSDFTFNVFLIFWELYSHMCIYIYMYAHLSLHGAAAAIWT